MCFLLGPRSRRQQTAGRVVRQEASVERITDYLERAVVFDRLAAEESNPMLKAKFESEASGYRKAASRRAADLGVELPEISN
jgi:hypothetical protein